MGGEKKLLAAQRGIYQAGIHVGRVKEHQGAHTPFAVQEIIFARFFPHAYRTELAHALYRGGQGDGFAGRKGAGEGWYIIISDRGNLTREGV